MHQAIPLCGSDTMTLPLLSSQLTKARAHLPSESQKLCKVWLRKTSLKHKTFEIAAFALVRLYIVKCKDKFPLFREHNSNRNRRRGAPSPGDGNGGDRTGRDKQQTPQAFPLETCTCRLATGVNLSQQPKLRKPSNIHKNEC